MGLLRRSLSASSLLRFLQACRLAPLCNLLRGAEVLLEQRWKGSVGFKAEAETECVDATSPLCS